MTVDDPELEGKLLAALEKTELRGGSDCDRALRKPVVKNLKVMARMGVYFEEEVQRRYPELRTRGGSGVGRIICRR